MPPTKQTVCPAHDMMMQEMNRDKGSIAKLFDDARILSNDIAKQLTDVRSEFSDLRVDMVRLESTVAAGFSNMITREEYAASQKKLEDVIIARLPKPRSRLTTKQIVAMATILTAIIGPGGLAVYFGMLKGVVP